MHERTKVRWSDMYLFVFRAALSYSITNWSRCRWPSLVLFLFFFFVFVFFVNYHKLQHLLWAALKCVFLWCMCLCMSVCVRERTACLVTVFSFGGKYVWDVTRFRISGPFHTKVIITGPLRPLVATHPLDPISSRIIILIKFVFVYKGDLVMKFCRWS